MAVTQTEIWNDVVGFEGLYQVSSLGRVRRLPGLRKARGGGLAKVPEKVWRGFVDSQGYFSVNLGRAKRVTVHRLVCEAFHGLAPKGRTQVAHYDGNKTNNRADNLRWADWEDNRADGKRLGEMPTGERHPRAILTKSQVLQIRKECGGAESRRSVARRRGLCHQHVNDIVNRRIWSDAA